MRNFVFVKTEAIVMNTVRHTDNMVVAHLFTRQYGMMSFAARRAGRGGRGLAAAMLQPLAQLVIECRQPGDHMQNLRYAELSPVHTSIPFHPHKATIAMFLSEFLWHALRGEEANDGLYEFLALSLRWLDGAETGFANFHLLLLLQLTRYLGYDPRMLPEAELLQMDTVMRHNYRTMRLLPLDAARRRHFLHLLMQFYKEHVPGFPEIKSLAIMESIYD